MKRLFVICISAALVSLAGCSDDEDVQPAQKERIVSFLTGTHAPRLVAEENLEEGSNQPYYTVSGDAVYRYITDIYNPDRVNWPEVTPASTVKITFRAYVFTYANIVTTGSENNSTLLYERCRPEKFSGRAGAQYRVVEVRAADGGYAAP